MSKSPAQRAVTESALSLLNHTYADYRRGRRGQPTGRGRILVTRSALGAFDVAATRRQGCYLRLISIVEAYVDLLSRELFGEKLPSPEEAVEALIEEIEKRSRGWGDRGANLKVFHEIVLKDCPAWKSYEAGTHVRNTIAHGLGRLSNRQLRNVDLPAKFALIDVRIRGGRLNLTERSLSCATRYCRDMVEQLDEAARV